RVVLSDAAPEVPRAAATRATAVAGVRLERRGFRDHAEALDFYRELHPDWLPVFHDLHARHQLRWNWARRLLEKADPDLYWLTRARGTWDDEMLWDRARTIAAPVLLLWGASSPYVTPELVDRLGGAVADFTAVRMECGHYIPRVLPQQFCDEVEA